MKKEQIKKMIEIALSQLAYSYTPYSDFKVGAALLGKNGRISPTGWLSNSRNY